MAKNVNLPSSRSEREAAWKDSAHCLSKLSLSLRTSLTELTIG